MLSLKRLSKFIRCRECAKKGKFKSFGESLLRKKRVVMICGKHCRAHNVHLKGEFEARAVKWHSRGKRLAFLDYCMTKC
jgi:hypothetical protein